MRSELTKTSRLSAMPCVLVHSGRKDLLAALLRRFGRKDRLHCLLQCGDVRLQERNLRLGQPALDCEDGLDLTMLCKAARARWYNERNAWSITSAMLGMWCPS